MKVPKNYKPGKESPKRVSGAGIKKHSYGNGGTTSPPKASHKNYAPSRGKTKA